MITVVVGPPCAGKSSFVRESAVAGDVVIDYDLLAQAFGSSATHDAPKDVREVAFAARAAAIGQVLNGIDTNAWIIHTSPAAAQMEDYKAAGAEVVVLDPGIDVCLARAVADERPERTEAAIRKWYESSASTEPAEKHGGLSYPKRRANMKIKSSPVRVKAGPDDGLEEGQFLVYPSTFTRTPDAYGDVIAPGAFADTITAWEDSGNVLPGLFGHRLDDPDFYVAAAIEMGEDDHGWWVKGEFDLESPKGSQVYRLVKGKRLNELSFAYDVADEGKVKLDDGTEANELRKVNVFEFSFVPVGANRGTSVVAVKATTDALARSMKAGRELSAEQEQSLRDARDSIDSVLGSLDESEDEDPSADPVGGEDQEMASGTGPVSDERPSPVKSATPSPNPSARALAELQLLAH